MMKKIAIGAGVGVLLLSIVGFFWVRSVFAHDNVRRALASQISSAIGQPVSIETISAGIYPRVTIKLGGVTIGQPARIQAQTLRLGTDLRALLSRQIVHATVHLDGARVELPLPPLGSTTGPAPGGESSEWPVELVSIDEIVLNDVDMVSGGRTLKGDVEAVPHAGGITLRKIELAAEDTQLTGSGEIKDLAGPVGEVAIKADALNFSRLLDFLTAFSRDFRSTGPAPTGGQGPPGRTTTPAPRAAATDLTVSLAAGRATMGSLVLDKLNGRARVTGQGVTLNPVAFGVFGGSYNGTMTVTPSAVPTFGLNATLSNIDVAALTAFAGTPGTISGRMAGRVQLAGQGAEVSRLMTSARGTARVDIRDGVVKRLGLVKTIVIATSMRADAKMPAAGGSNDEAFSELGATLAIANGTARTSDLRFQSPDVTMSAAGSLRLDGSAIDLRGNVQLSDALSKQAGRDLVRYTQEQGRVTLPATVTGSAQSPAVRVDMGNLFKRALQNKANEELQKALGKKFRSLIPR
jgi:uncharacterized protein involved in outer membrane biogenesis